MKLVLLLFPFFKCVNQGTERFNNLPKDTQLSKYRAEIQAQAVWL